MGVIATAVQQLRVGPAACFENLVVVPLFGDTPQAFPDYLTLDQALAAGEARVTEVSEAGSVPELRFVNEGARPVLLLDGEELVGAKQNRVLNLSVMVAARASVAIPVSCVEAGRWRHVSREFMSEGRVQYASGRAVRGESVSDCMDASGGYLSDQGAVWEDISAKSVRMGTRSATSAMKSLYEDHAAALQAYQSAFGVGEGQLGAVFMLAGRVAGVDLLDHPRSWAALFPKLVGSYALDALDTAVAGTDAPALPPQDSAAQFLADVAAGAEKRFPALGMGEDLRVSAASLRAAALAIDGGVVHLCAFPRNTARQARTDTRMARASARGRHH